MKKPERFSEMLGRLFLLLGAVFLLCGVLSRAGMMKTVPNSYGDPGAVFPVLGGALLAAGAVFLLAEGVRARRRAALLRDGVPVPGKVVSVRQLVFTTVGTSHPFVVRFVYRCGGDEYRGKSGLFWDPPELGAGDAVTVYTDPEHPRRCVLEPPRPKEPPYAAMMR